MTILFKLIHANFYLKSDMRPIYLNSFEHLLLKKYLEAYCTIRTEYTLYNTVPFSYYMCIYDMDAFRVYYSMLYIVLYLNNCTL